jgi:hypothetical protein
MMPGMMKWIYVSGVIRDYRGFNMPANIVHYLFQQTMLLLVALAVIANSILITL